MTEIDTLWMDNFKAILHFVFVHDRLPLLNSFGSERMLATWVVHQLEHKPDSSIWQKFADNYAAMFAANARVKNARLVRVVSAATEEPTEPILADDDSSAAAAAEIVPEVDSEVDSEMAEETPPLSPDNQRWFAQFDALIAFTAMHGKLPSALGTINGEKLLTSWYYNQQTKFKTRVSYMNDESRRAIWQQFLDDNAAIIPPPRYAFTTDGPNDRVWQQNFAAVKQFIATHNCLPASVSTDATERSYGCWLSKQNWNYNKHLCRMRNDSHRAIWMEFTENFNLSHRGCDEVIEGHNTKWARHFAELKEFIAMHNRLPKPSRVNHEENVLNTWIKNQQYRFANEILGMKSESRRIIWRKFVDENPILFPQKRECDGDGDNEADMSPQKRARVAEEFVTEIDLS